MFLGKLVLKICSKFTGKHPWQGATSIKLQSNFIEIALRYVCSPVNFLHIFKTLFAKSTFGRPLLTHLLTAVFFNLLVQLSKFASEVAGLELTFYTKHFRGLLQAWSCSSNCEATIMVIIISFYFTCVEGTLCRCVHKILPFEHGDIILNRSNNL